MKESIKHVIDTVVTHPKTLVAVTAAANANVWTDYGEPAVKIVTGVLPIVVLVLLVTKHALDIKKEHFTKKD